MDMQEPQFVPKVHPLERGSEPEDPLELMGEVVPGDPLIMLDCMLQEFAWMGYDAAALYSLFSNPGYPVLCALREEFGDAAVRARIQALMSDWGRLQFRETLVEEECHFETGPRTFQIELPASACTKETPSRENTDPGDCTARFFEEGD
jgi:hypothetical protein